MKTIISILCISIFLALNANAQQPFHIIAHHDLTPFVGTWMATKDNMKYEITFKEGVSGFEINGNKYTMEIVFVSCIKWLRDGKIIREVKTDAPKSILEGSVSEIDPLFLSVLCHDEEKKYVGSGTFTIDNAKNPQKAKWTHRPTGFRKNKGETDFPYLLDFIKVK